MFIKVYVYEGSSGIYRHLNPHLVISVSQDQRHGCTEIRMMGGSIHTVKEPVDEVLGMLREALKPTFSLTKAGGEISIDA